jgi:hypothetical protein
MQWMQQKKGMSTPKIPLLNVRVLCIDDKEMENASKHPFDYSIRTFYTASDIQVQPTDATQHYPYFRKISSRFIFFSS